LSVQEYDQPIVVVEPIFAQSSKSREPRKINPKDKTKVKVITITKPPVQVQADKTVGIINTNIPPKVKEKVIIDGQKIVNAPVPTTQFKPSRKEKTIMQARNGERRAGISYLNFSKF
jgi:hypothetical protein